MADKRMFAKTIIDSDTFLEMPATAQLLYFHLSMRADDDGFVNQPRAIMRICGSKEDDMKILIERQFVIPFESGIVVIRHWRIHNYIRKDTYRETVYTAEKNTLEVVAGVYENSDCVTNPSRTRDEPVTNPSRRIDKIREDKFSTDKISSLVNSDEMNEELDCKKILDLFGEICISLPKPYQLNKTRISRIKKANKDLKGDFESFFKRIENSDFLTGRIKGCDFKASFDWVLKPANFIKITEGNYDNRDNRPADPYGYTDTPADEYI